MTTGQIGGFVNPTMSNFTQTPAPAQNDNNTAPVQQQASLGGNNTRFVATNNPQYTLPPAANNNYQTQYQPQYQQGVYMNNQSTDMARWADNIKSQLYPELPNVLLQLARSCRITPDEYNWLQQVLNIPGQSNRLMDRAIAPFYGRPSVGITDILDQVRGLMESAISQRRQETFQRSSYGYNYNPTNYDYNNQFNSFNNSGFNAPGVMMTNDPGFNQTFNPMAGNFGMMPNTFNPGAIGANSFGNSFQMPPMQGMQQPQMQNDSNNWMSQVNSDNRSVPPRTTPVDNVTRPRVDPNARYTPKAPAIKQPTGRAENIDVDLDEKTPVVKTPRWSDLRNSCDPDLVESLEAEVDYLTSYLVSVGENKIFQRNFKLKLPTQSTYGAFTDLTTIHTDMMDPAMEESFAHRVIYDSLNIETGINTDNARRVFAQCRQYLLNGKNTGLQPYLQIIAELEKNKQSLVHVIHSLITKFNDAASVNFVQVLDDGAILSFVPCKSLQDIASLMVDNGDETYAVWKEDKVAFSRALSACISYSFGAFFQKDEKFDPVLNLDDENNLAVLAADEGNRIRLKNGMSSRLVFAIGDEKTRKEQINEFKALAKRHAAIRVKHRVVFHNLNLFDDIEKGDFSAHLPGSESAELFLRNLVDKHGTVELTGLRGEDQFEHPILVGLTYDGSIIGRRI